MHEPCDDLLLLCKVPRGVVRAVDIRNDVRVPTVCSIFSFGKPAGGIMIEEAPVNDAVVPVGVPPARVFEVANVVKRGLLIERRQSFASSDFPRHHIAHCWVSEWLLIGVRHHRLAIRGVIR